MAGIKKREIVNLSSFTHNRPLIYTEQITCFKFNIGYQILKRFFDFFAALIALLVLFLPMLVIAVVIAIDSPGSPIFTQVRLGKDGKPFTIYKFRSMRLDAEKNGAQWAEDCDPRVTRVGGFLRKNRIDELPQLLNILIGQMSIVGPRPERPEFYDAFDRYLVGFRQRILVKPGLTGLAQVNGGYDLLPEEKIVYDLEYIKNQSLRMDFSCILKTVRLIFTHKGAR